MPSCRLERRGIVKVVGEEARAFLQRIVSCDMEAVSPERAAYGALLTPQGKIVADFLVIAAPEAMGGGFLIDLPLALAPEMVKRLNLYKLRAHVIIEDISAVLSISAGWGDTPRPAGGLSFDDPRHPALGWRQIALTERASMEDLGVTFARTAASDADERAFQAHRIALAIPEGGSDFFYLDAFPHEANLDRLGGVDFAKGCYVGQEVVSRMQHKTEVRKRVIAVSFADFAPEAGLEVTAGGVTLGLMGSGLDGKGLAMIRIDRAREALAKGEEPSAGGIPLTLHLPEAA